MRFMSNKKPIITKGNLSARELFIIAAVMFVLFVATHSVLAAVVFDVCLLAGIIIAIWNYFEARHASNEERK